MNTIFSFTMLLFMVGTVALLPAGQVQVRAERQRPRHLLGHRRRDLARSSRPAHWVGSAAPSPVALNWMFDTHKAALITGFVLVVVYYFLFYLVLKA